MTQITKDRVVFSRRKWDELKSNPYYAELIEDIEDMIELEKAIDEHKKSGQKTITLEQYLQKKKRVS